MHKLTIILMALTAAACQKGAAATAAAVTSDDCPAFMVSVDGKPVENLTRGLAYTMVNEGYRTEMVDVFNQPGVTCADVLARAQPTVEGRILARAFGGPAQGLALDAYTHLENVTRIAAKPAKVGDKMTICVKETAFSPNAGAFEGKRVVFSGSFTGEYCGDKLN